MGYYGRDANAGKVSSAEWFRSRETFRNGPVARTGKRNRRKVWDRSRAGVSSGILGASSGQRMGCRCCNHYGDVERRVIRRKERQQWRREWSV